MKHFIGVESHAFAVSGSSSKADHVFLMYPPLFQINENKKTLVTGRLGVLENFHSPVVFTLIVEGFSMLHEFCSCFWFRHGIK